MAPTVKDKIPVWLDCDPGHDDAFAILLAAYHPALELLGISTVHGNSSVEHTTINAGSILTAIGRPDIPVYKGASHGLTRPAVHAPDIHGASGLDGTTLLPQPALPARTHPTAIDAAAAALLATPPQTAWLVATGTLTNAARLFAAYPALARHLRGFSLMGGAVGDGFTDAPLGTHSEADGALPRPRCGNWTPYAEFNIVCDPEAGAALFGLPELAQKTVMVGLDLTHQVLATPAVQQLLLYGPRGVSEGREPSRLRVMLVELLTYFAQTYARVFGITAGPPLHDPLAVAAVLDGVEGWEAPLYDFDPRVAAGPGRRERERFAVKVVTEGTHEQALRGETETGRTLVKLLPQGEDGVKIPRGVDLQRFWALIEDCLRLADEKNERDGTVFV